MFSFREIRKLSKIEVARKEYKTNQEIVKELKEPLKNVKWSNKNFIWDNFIFYKIIGMNPYIEIKDKKYYVIINNIYIQIKEQSYFEILFVDKIKKYMKDWFDDQEFLRDDIIYFENNYLDKTNKLYRIDMKIKVSDTKFIAVEYFEKYHYDIDNIDLRNEESRLLHILNKNEIVKIFIFWTTKLTDKKYFNKFIKEVYNTINIYKNIDDEEFWIVREINNYVKNYTLSKCFFEAYNNNNEPIIDLDEINSLIKFKDDEYKEKHYEKFINDIKLLTENDLSIDIDIDDGDSDVEIIEETKTELYYSNNKLSLNGLWRYLKIDSDYLVDIFEEQKIINLSINITKGFIDGLKTQKKILEDNNYNKIVGLHDY